MQSQAQTNWDSLQIQSERTILTDPVNSLKILDYIVQNSSSEKAKAQSNLKKAKIYFYLNKYSLAVDQLTYLENDEKSLVKEILWDKRILVSAILDSLNMPKQADEILQDLFKQQNENSDLKVRQILRDSLIDLSQLLKIENAYLSSDTIRKANELNQIRFKIAKKYKKEGNLDLSFLYFSKLENKTASSLFTYLGKVGKAEILTNKGLIDDSNKILNELIKVHSPFESVILKDVYRLLATNYHTIGNMDSYIKYNDLYIKLVEKELEEKQKTRLKVLDLLEIYSSETKKEELSTIRLLIYVLLSLFFLIFCLFIYKLYRSKKKIAQFTEEKKKQEWLDTSRKEIEAKFQEEKNTNFIIPEKTESNILRKLKEFEDSAQFLKQDLSLSSLAKELNSNTTYLSEIINKHKGKNFKSYVNELRIHYIVEKLKNYPEYRTYKISYLAEEAGFLSRTSFASIFKSVMGITPSAFIESLQKNTP